MANPRRADAVHTKLAPDAGLSHGIPQPRRPHMTASSTAPLSRSSALSRARRLGLILVLAGASLLWTAVAPAAADSVVATIPVGDSPYGVAFSPDGSTAY